MASRPDVRAKSRESHYIARYGLTLEQVESGRAAQGHKCLICGKTPKRWHIDHCHTTKKIRGMICQQCNIGIGAFRDDRRVLWRAIDYLLESV